MRPSILVSWLVLLAMTAPAFAQTGSGYDRAPRYVLFPPNAAGGSSVVIVMSLESALVGTGDNASTQADLFVNGVPVASNTWNMLGESGPGSCSFGCSGSDCGGMYVDGVFNTMTCMDLDDDCECGHWFTWDPGYDPSPGDQVLVVLGPAPGALPESDTTNDSMSQTYDGTSSGWNRGIDSLQIIDNGDGTATASHNDHLIVSNIGASGDDGVYDYDVDIVDDLGTVYHTQRIEVSTAPSGPAKGTCFIGCAPLSCGNFVSPWFPAFGSCKIVGNWFDCGCVVEANIQMPVFPLPPVGVKIVLKPVPGALPELPGFEDDDERRPDPATSVPDLEQALGLTNHPNPFNPSTTFSFRLPVSGETELTIYDARGQQVRTLHAGVLPAGPHQFTWDGLNETGHVVASGVYFSQLRLDDQTVQRRLTLIK